MEMKKPLLNILIINYLIGGYINKVFLEIENEKMNFTQRIWE